MSDDTADDKTKLITVHADRERSVTVGGIVMQFHDDGGLPWEGFKWMQWDPQKPVPGFICEPTDAYGFAEFDRFVPFVDAWRQGWEKHLADAAEKQRQMQEAAERELAELMDAQRQAEATRQAGELAAMAPPANTNEPQP